MGTFGDLHCSSGLVRGDSSHRDYIAINEPVKSTPKMTGAKAQWRIFRVL